MVSFRRRGFFRHESLRGTRSHGSPLPTTPVERVHDRRQTRRPLPFMDTTVNRQGSKLQTEVFRKPMHTGRYLSFEPHHPPQSKRSVVRALMKRKQYVTAGEDAVRAEKAKVRNELAVNEYPVEFVNDAMKDRSTNKKGGRKLGTAVIPYCRGTSEAIRCVLESHNIRTVIKPKKLRWTLTKGAKDMLPAEKESGVSTRLVANSVRTSTSAR